jgi:hypothetical protein
VHLDRLAPRRHEVDVQAGRRERRLVGADARGDRGELGFRVRS